MKVSSRRRIAPALLSVLLSVGFLACSPGSPTTVARMEELAAIKTFAIVAYSRGDLLWQSQESHFTSGESIDHDCRYLKDLSAALSVETGRTILGPDEIRRNAFYSRLLAESRGASCLARAEHFRQVPHDVKAILLRELSVDGVLAIGYHQDIRDVSEAPSFARLGVGTLPAAIEGFGDADLYSVNGEVVWTARLDRIQGKTLVRARKYPFLGNQGTLAIENGTNSDTIVDEINTGLGTSLAHLLGTTFRGASTRP